MTLVRSFDSLSPAIRSALTATSIIPVVELNTPTGTVTLLDAKVVNISPAAMKGKIPSLTPTGWVELNSFSFGAGQSGSGCNASGSRSAGKLDFGDLNVGKKGTVESISFQFESLLAGIHHRRH